MYFFFIFFYLFNFNFILFIFLLLDVFSKARTPLELVETKYDPHQPGEMSFKM